MSHSRSIAKYNRITNSHVMKGLMRALITHENINTQFTRAKALKMSIERIITSLAKRDCLANRRKAFSALDNDKELGNKLIEISARYRDRPGGYVRVLKNGVRASDSCTMAYVSFV